MDAAQNLKSRVMHTNGRRHVKWLSISSLISILISISYIIFRLISLLYSAHVSLVMWIVLWMEMATSGMILYCAMSNKLFSSLTEPIQYLESSLG